MINDEDSEVERLARRINGGLDGISFVLVGVLAIVIGLVVVFCGSLLINYIGSLFQ